MKLFVGDTASYQLTLFLPSLDYYIGNGQPHNPQFLMLEPGLFFY
jgi:hypothetical protein